MASTSDFRIGMVIMFNGELHRIEEYIHRTPGNLRAFVQAKLRNLRSGRVQRPAFGPARKWRKFVLNRKNFNTFSMTAPVINLWIK
jgi:translation elongation factor P/translation initiation factor 5A